MAWVQSCLPSILASVEKRPALMTSLYQCRWDGFDPRMTYIYIFCHISLLQPWVWANLGCCCVWLSSAGHISSSRKSAIISRPTCRECGCPPLNLTSPWTWEPTATNWSPRLMTTQRDRHSPGDNNGLNSTPWPVTTTLVLPILQWWIHTLCNVYHCSS